MRKVLKRFSAFALAVTLICLQAGTIWAAADSSVPSVANVRSEAQATAAYLLQQSDFSDLSDTSRFYHASSDLILAIRAGIDCDVQAGAYLDSVRKLLDSDGTLTVPVAAYAYPNDVFMCHAYLLMVLALTGQDAADFNGADVISGFNRLLADTTPADFIYGFDPATYENTGMNPYYLGIVYSAAAAYADSLQDFDRIESQIKSALIQLTGTNGIQYYGYSADNNGMVYPHFERLSRADETVRALIDTAVTATKEVYFSEADGTTHTIYTDNVTGEVIDESSVDSTALALALYAQFGRTETAAKSYHALLSFRSASTPGAFEGYDPLYASQDALIGLVTYLRALEGHGSPFDVRDALDEAKEQPEDQAQIPPLDSGGAKPPEETASPETADPFTAGFWLGSLAAAGLLLAIPVFFRHPHLSKL